MAKFLTGLSARLLNCVAYEGRGEWELLDDVVFQSDVARNYWISQGKSGPDAEALSLVAARKGYRTDFMSVPPIQPGVVSLSRSRRGGAIHDALYSVPHDIPDREVCDQILKEMFVEDLVECGADRVAAEAEAEVVYLGVRLGGGAHWQ